MARLISPPPISDLPRQLLRLLRLERGLSKASQQLLLVMRDLALSPHCLASACVYVNLNLRSKTSGMSWMYWKVAQQKALGLFPMVIG